MNVRGQGQKAGAHSKQIQVSGDYIQMEGVSEERAFEIARQVSKQAVTEYAAESEQLAMERIGRFDAKMVQTLAQADLLGGLADPAVQFTLRKAQIGAATTEREDDYDILSSLIEDRISRAEERPVRAGINRAIEVVSDIDGPALLAITVTTILAQIRPLSGYVDRGIDTIESILAAIVKQDALPQGAEWIEHLDLLGVVRINPLSANMARFAEFYPARTPGYVTLGIPEEEDMTDRFKRLTLANLGVPLTDHPFKPGFKRVPLPFAEAIEDWNLTPEQKGRALTLLRDEFNVDRPDPSLFAPYMTRVRERKYHSIVSEWWDAIPRGFNITGVGKLIGRANAKRLDKQGRLPEFD